MNKWVMIWSIKTRDTNKFNNKYMRRFIFIFEKQTHTKEREKIYRMINCWVHSFIVLNLRKSFGHGFQLIQLVKSLMVV